MLDEPAVGTKLGIDITEDLLIEDPQPWQLES